MVYRRSIGRWLVRFLVFQICTNEPAATADAPRSVVRHGNQSPVMTPKQTQKPTHLTGALGREDVIRQGRSPVTVSAARQVYMSDPRFFPALRVSHRTSGLGSPVTIEACPACPRSICGPNDTTRRVDSGSNSGVTTSRRTISVISAYVLYIRVYCFLMVGSHLTRPKVT